MLGTCSKCLQWKKVKGFVNDNFFENEKNQILVEDENEEVDDDKAVDDEEDDEDEELIEFK